MNEEKRQPDKHPDDDNLRIDVESVIREKAPRYYRYIPRFVIRRLERIICQDRMNAFLEYSSGLRDADFCRALLDYNSIEVDFEGLENLPPVADRRVLFVSNHPLGGLDGMALIDFVSRRYGSGVKFIVNSLLSAVKPLEGVFVPINKHGAQSREAAEAVDEAFAADNPIIMFPAGLVSRLNKKGEIADLEWQKMFVTKAKKFRRTIIPLHFYGENSSFFYKFAKFRKAIGLKFNIEMIYLPREVFLAEDKKFRVVIGKPVSYESLGSGNPKDLAGQIRETVYKLKPYNY